jgi:SAM-dependent methyltransferase
VASAPDSAAAKGSPRVGYLKRVFAATENVNRRAILAVAEPRPGATLVDLGCGDGRFTVQVGRRVGAARTVGVEFIETLAAAAEARGIEVRRADLNERLPFESGTVDVVHSNQVIEHLAGTDHFMRELRRILSPGGYAIVSTNNLASLHNIASLVLGYQPPPCHVSDERIGVGNPLNAHGGDPGAAGQMHLRLFTGRALAELAELHGLRVEVARTAGFYPFPPRLAAVATRVAPRWGAFLVQRYGVA